jgi:uncharacterized protein YutE (UPF0331/DUF86 family)
MSPGEVDVDVVRRHLVALRDAVRVLTRHTGHGIDTLEHDSEERWAVERGLHLCAQNALDIATHIAAGEGRDVPDYASALVELGRLGILPSSFAKEFSSVAGFRDVLVHGYLEVDLTLLHRLLNERLDDFEIFAGAVDEYLRRL